MTAARNAAPPPPVRAVTGNEAMDAAIKATPTPRKSKFKHQVFDLLMKDGTEYLDVAIIHADRVLGESTAAKHKWGDERPLYQVTFWVWAALRRTKRIGAELKFETFVGDVEELQKQDEDEDVDPTQVEDTFD